MALSGRAALSAVQHAPRSAVISGGFGALATSTAKALIATQKYQKLYLLYPPFEQSKVYEALSNYTPEEQEHLLPMQCDLLNEEAVQERFAEIEEHSENSMVRCVKL